MASVDTLKRSLLLAGIALVIAPARAQEVPPTVRLVVG
jgi:hypothetical protein